MKSRREIKEKREKENQILESLKPAEKISRAFSVLEIEQLLEQVHQLYNQYFLGIEKKPPSMQRTILDDKIKNLDTLHLSNAADRFKAQAVKNKYVTFKELWEKKMPK